MRNLRILIGAAVLGAVVLAACADLTGAGRPRLDANSVTGEWVEPNEIPGSSQDWLLTLTDTVLTGTGVWFGEACCDGHFVVTGYASRDSLHADVLFYLDHPRADSVAYSTEHFDAALASRTELRGTSSRDGGPTYGFDLVKRAGPE